VCTVLGAVIHTFNYHRDFHIPADTVTRSEALRTQLLASLGLGPKPAASV
jgi:cytochrome o ubiquinol oxidase subunit 1